MNGIRINEDADNLCQGIVGNGEGEGFEDVRVDVDGYE